MSKQQSLKPQRDYRLQPRTAHEFDTEHRDDFYDESPSLTKQADAEGADINNIVRRYLQTGVAPGYQGDPMYGDFSDVHDFRAALEIVAEANAQFAGLEANVRARFDNDPAKFLEFVNNPNNGDELVKMGLAEVRKKEESEREILKGIRDNLKAPKSNKNDTSTASKEKGDT